MTNKITPDVSIIIATKNSAFTIKRCLKSLLVSIEAFLPNEVEVIFVDYKSNDGTIEEIKKFPNSIVLETNKRGIAQAHNLGVDRSNGRYICFLNSDDEHTKFFIKYLFEAMRTQSKQPCVTYSTVTFINENNEDLYNRYPPIYFQCLHRHSSIILHPNAMYPSALMKEFRFAETADNDPTDREQVLEIMRRARPVRVPKAVYRFRIWGRSETVQRASNSRKTKDLSRKLKELISRLYIHAYENRKLFRLFNKIFGKTYWTMVK